MLADPIIFDFCIMGQHAYSTGPAKKEKKNKGKGFFAFIFIGNVLQMNLLLMKTSF